MTVDQRGPGCGPRRPSSPDGVLERQVAIDRIKGRRRFRIELGVSALGMLVLVIIWATSEYHNSGGFPSGGFSESSGAHDVWNVWIVYPLLAWVLFVVVRGWTIFGSRSISEQAIEREMARRARLD